MFLFGGIWASGTLSKQSSGMLYALLNKNSVSEGDLNGGSWRKILQRRRCLSVLTKACSCGILVKNLIAFSLVQRVLLIFK